MTKRGIIYLFIPLMIVVAYTILFSFLSKPKESEAQICLNIQLRSCQTGSTCTPVCPDIDSMLSSDIVNTGYTPGAYGIQIRTGICFTP